MARYKKSIPATLEPDQLFTIAQNFLQSKGYVYQTYHGDNVFRKGEGFMTAPRFIKVSFAPGCVVLEAWNKMVILPGLFIGEFDIFGLYGAATNGPVKEVVKQLEQTLYYAQKAPEQAPQPDQGQQ